MMVLPSHISFPEGIVAKNRVRMGEGKPVGFNRAKRTPAIVANQRRVFVAGRHQAEWTGLCVGTG